MTRPMQHERCACGRGVIGLVSLRVTLADGTVRLVDRRTCSSCGAWLSLGPSDETDPRCAVEVRAAELAYLSRNGSAADFVMAMNTVEHVGFLMADRADSWAPISGGAQAGWLARVIADHHDAEQAGNEREG